MIIMIIIIMVIIIMIIIIMVIIIMIISLCEKCGLKAQKHFWCTLNLNLLNFYWMN